MLTAHYILTVWKYNKNALTTKSVWDTPIPMEGQHNIKTTY